MAGFFSNTHHKYPTPIDPATPQIKYQGTIRSVSFSTLSTFEQCPYHVYLSKVHNGGCKPLGSTAMNRGSQIHEMLEAYVNGVSDKVTWSAMKSRKYYAPIIEEFRETRIKGLCFPELDLAFTKEMQKTDWMAPNAWLRGAIDIAVFNKDKTHCDIYDYKTGSNRSAVKHRSQLMLYACMMFILYPKLQTLRCAAIYLDHRSQPFFTDYHRQDLDLFWPRFKARLLKVTDAVEFLPNPNAFTCAYCSHKEIRTDLNHTKPLCDWAHTRV